MQFCSIRLSLQLIFFMKTINAFGIFNYQTTIKKITPIEHWSQEALATAGNDDDNQEDQFDESKENLFKFDDDYDYDYEGEQPTKTTQPLFEGAFCRRSFDKRGGYCILAYKCLHVIREFRVHGTPIDICTYSNSLPVICCPLGDKHVQEQRISATKCQEYNIDAQGLHLGDTDRSFSGKQCVPSIPLIVGGTPTFGNLFPHMVALGWTQKGNDIKWGCGGTLVSEMYVLTAAHCATSGSKPPDMVRLGSKTLNETSSWQQDIKILDIILHPKYRSASYYHDVALFKLTKPAQLTERVRPACLWQSPDLNIPTVVATGWGRTEFLGAKSNTLQQVDLDLIEQERCQNIYRKERRMPNGIIDSQFCAGHLPGGKDTCQGDSGGPVHAVLPENNCIAFVIGITSFGKFCAAPNAPGVYTKLYSYLDWIEKIVFKKHME